MPLSLKLAYLEGLAEALEKFGLKTAAEEIRLKIPRREFHGADAAFKNVTDKPKKQANDGVLPLEAQGHPESPVERLTQLLQQEPAPSEMASDATRNPLDRATAWGTPSNLSGGDAGSRASSMGQNTSTGAV